MTKPIRDHALLSDCQSAALVTCWVAVDRAVGPADRIAPPADVARWRAARDELRAVILREGWSAERGAFTGAFGSDHLILGKLGMRDRVELTRYAIRRGLVEP